VAAPPDESSDHHGATTTASTSATPRTHTVKRGETLTGLARRYGVSVEALRQANGMSGRETLRAGAALRIPG
jgi:membrane-bound lytic murein transglycosylase D